MDKYSAQCLWGDYPGLNHGPKSREHEGRFAQRRSTESQMLKSGSATPINGNNESNRAI